MKIEDVLKLIDAGYSRDEIIAMDQPEQKEEEQKEPEKKEEEPKEQEKKEEEHDKDIMKQMEQMLKDMWNANIKNSKMPESEDTAEDIIASIISPNKKENRQ